MGYCVLHLEKAKGADNGMSAHIERTIVPKNIDPTRTHLNRELVKFPDGVDNRTAAIRHRLDTAGLKRKIGKNQVQAIRIVLSGTHEDMARMENEGRLGEWCDDSVAWLRETYGAENLVSAVLHMDEETPHIHATVVPIVQDESTCPTPLCGRGDEPCQPYQVSGHLRRTHGEVRAEKRCKRVSRQAPLHTRVLPQPHHAGRGHTGEHCHPAVKRDRGKSNHCRGRAS